MDEFDANKTVDAVWCVDSETGKKFLLDRKTGQVLTTEDEINRQGA